MDNRHALRTVARGMPLAGSLGIAILACTLASAQTSTRASIRTSAAATASRAPALSLPHSQRGEQYYAERYGVDQLQVRWTASGQSVEFRYRVRDPVRAAALSNKKASPILLDARAGIKLAVPEVENVGSLRQVAPPEAGKEYWMLFQNRGKRVKPGDRVDIVIGSVRLNGLYVQ